MVYPDDANIRYTEYVHAAVSHSGAVFDRPGVANPYGIASPGTRINFRTDAARVSIVVTYTFACNAPGCGLFSVERDGRLLSYTFGSNTTVGQATYQLAWPPLAGVHNYSVIWPYGTQMVFQGLRLEGGSQRLAPPVSQRPARLHVAYGDSITQGYYAASGIVGTYPDQVARKKSWSVVNMGFAGETTVPSDGSAVAALHGDIVSLAIGVNDFNSSKPLAAFRSDYAALLDSVRAVQPNVPLYCVTPIWTTLETVQNGQGLCISVTTGRRSARSSSSGRQPTRTCT
jgi:hypothetical protein